jgi:hypothetical protein
MRMSKWSAAGVGVLASFAFSAASAQPISGAIFTTDASGVPVNLNQYEAKEDVYLNGGPGLNAPDDAAGLPAGTYTFMVTDPSGKVLLSSDAPECRQVVVDDSGVFTAVVPAGGCEHAIGADLEDGGITVQLFPFDDTPNNGGVYKVWVTPTELLDCDAPGNKFCFVPRYSKTDNFKVNEEGVVEIDVRFWKGGMAVDGLAAEKFDTRGASNRKWSEWNPRVLAFHEAHFEAVEQGLHVVTVQDQPGCKVTRVEGAADELYAIGAGGRVEVPVRVKNHKAGDHTYFIDVACQE